MNAEADSTGGTARHVLVACEESQVVTTALRARGVEAFSCDVDPCSGGRPEWHLQADVREVLASRSWIAVLAFPPCTHLAASGARWFAEKRADGRQQRAIAFFELFTQLPARYVAIENPVGVMSRVYRKPDQIIHPWQFGHGETKKTCLWLKGLPMLHPTRVVPGREPRVWRLPPTPDRARLRSKTYPGIAVAMAQTWAPYFR